VRLLSWSDSDRRKQSSFKLKEGRFRLDTRKNFFTQRMARPWHSYPEKLWYPIPGGIQDQVGWGPGKPVPLLVVVGNSAHGRDVRTR